MTKIYNLAEITYSINGRLMLINARNIARIRKTLAAEKRRGKWQP
jgi:hypothetical protein